MSSDLKAVSRVDPPEWDFTDRLRAIRTKVANLGQTEFGRALGLTRAAYGTYETGRHRPRDLVAFAKRVELLTGVSATWLLGLDDPAAVGPVTVGKATTKGS